MPEPPLSIALVSEHASPLAAVGGADAGGQNVYVRGLAVSLGRLGHRVTVYTRRTSTSEPASAPLGPRARVVHVPAGPPVAIPKEDLAPLMGDLGDQLAVHWQDDPPDLVHAHYWMSGIATLRGTRRTPIPVVQTFHALAHDKLRFLRASLERERESGRLGAERAVAQITDSIITMTESEADEIREVFGVPASRVSVVPCGVDLACFSVDGPAAPRSSRPRLLTVGRLVARKGLSTVIEALTSVPSAELVVAGGPAASELPADSEFVRLHSLAQSRGVGSRVRFLGQVPHEEVPALLRSADVFVCAPWYEPFGMAALEAAACGLPIVATDVGGLRDTVLDGVTGYLVPPASASALASRLRGLLDDPGRRAAFGATAARRAARYSWDHITEEILSVYRSVLNSQQP